MITPTTDSGNPAAATARSIVGDTSFAFPTTATSATKSSARLIKVVYVDGRAAC
jgi:hypothetical protein